MHPGELDQGISRGRRAPRSVEAPLFRPTVEQWVALQGRITPLERLYICVSGGFKDKAAYNKIMGRSDEEVAAIREGNRGLVKEIQDLLDSSFAQGEKERMRLAFGMDSGRMPTLEEVGEAFARTRQQIAEREGTRLRRSRRPSATRLLKDYLE